MLVFAASVGTFFDLQESQRTSNSTVARTYAQSAADEGALTY